MTKQQKEKLVLAIVKANPHALIGSYCKMTADARIDADDIIGVNLHLKLPRSQKGVAERRRLDRYNMKFAQFHFDQRSTNVQALYNFALTHVDAVDTASLTADELISWFWLPVTFTDSPCMKPFRRATPFDSYIACLCKCFLNIDVKDAKEAELQLVLMGKFPK